MIDTNNNLLNSLVDKCTKEFDLIAAVLELTLGMIFSNFNRLPEQNQQRNQSANVNFHALSSNNTNSEISVSRADMHSRYHNLVDGVRGLFRKECNDSLLINFGLEIRPSYHLS